MFPGRKMKLETYFTQGEKFHRVSNLKVRNNTEGGNRATTTGRNLSLLKVETIEQKRVK